MRLVTFETGEGGSALGVLESDRVIPVAEFAAALPTGIREALVRARDVGDIAFVDGVVPALSDALATAPKTRGVAVGDVRLLSPVLSPRRVIGVGLNFRSHAEEQGARIPRQPILFAKWTDSVVGPHAVVQIPYAEAEVDYECEVTVVIGRGGRDIPVESALDHVFGITAMNDLSDRKAQLAERQWTRAKSFDGFSPMGPAVVTMDEIPSVGDISLSTILNGEVVQRGSTSDLIFDIPTLVAFASQGTTLQPGDVIATGTPSGVGFVKEPPVYLKPGDVVTVSVEYVGDLTTTIGPARDGAAS